MFTIIFIPIYGKAFCHIVGSHSSGTKGFGIVTFPPKATLVVAPSTEVNWARCKVAQDLLLIDSIWQKNFKTSLPTNLLSVPMTYGIVGYVLNSFKTCHHRYEKDTKREKCNCCHSHVIIQIFIHDTSCMHTGVSQQPCMHNSVIVHYTLIISRKDGTHMKDICNRWPLCSCTWTTNNPQITSASVPINARNCFS